MHQMIIQTAERVLSQAFDQSIRLHLSDVIYDYAGSPSTILRCTTNGESQPIPKSVIVKRSKNDNQSLLYETAGLSFLAEFTDSLVPDLYGLDYNDRILVMEDLGSPSEALLGNILFAHDADGAEQALTEHQRALARMHLATMEEEHRFGQILAEYHNPTQPSRHRVHTISEALRKLPANFELIGIMVDSATRQDIEAAIAMIDAPGPFLALVHGDATPANAFYTDGAIRLFDLETAGFRHCLLDGCFSRLRYIHSVWAREIPLLVQHRLMAAYRDTLLAGCTVDRTVFEHHLAACCAGWMAGLCMLLPGVIDQDRKWGRSTNRQRIVAGMNHFAVITDELGVFGALAGTCRSAERRLRRQWPEEDCTMRIYPAFTS